MAARLTEGGPSTPSRLSDCVQIMTTRLSQLEKSFQRTSSALETSRPHVSSGSPVIATPNHTATLGKNQEDRGLVTNNTESMTSEGLTRTMVDNSERNMGQAASISPCAAVSVQPGQSLGMVEHSLDTNSFSDQLLETFATDPQTSTVPYDNGETPQQIMLHPRQIDNDVSIDDELDSAPEPTGKSSLLGLMADLDRTVWRDTERPGLARRNTISTEGPSPPRWGLRDEHETQVKNAETLVRLNNGALFRSSFDVFFRYISPHHQMINENEFRSCFDDVVFNSGAGMSAFDKQQFLALVFLVHAETKLLHGSCSDPTIVLGWQDFCTADHLLSRSLWLGKGNILTLSVLVSRARFLLYMEKLNLAHDSVCGAIRLCFQLSLHNQSTWQNLDSFEIIMRQRAFWSIFQLDRSVASTSGLPPMIRDADFNVDLPPPLDDRGIFPGRALPTPTPEQSAVPYMYGVVKWAKLHSEIWNAAFGVKAVKPLNPEMCEAFNEAIKQLVYDLPACLRWDTDVGKRQDELPSFLRRQRLSLHLVCIPLTPRFDDYPLIKHSVQTT